MSIPLVKPTVVEVETPYAVVVNGKSAASDELLTLALKSVQLAAVIQPNVEPSALSHAISSVVSVSPTPAVSCVLATGSVPVNASLSSRSSAPHS